MKGEGKDAKAPAGPVNHTCPVNGGNIDAKYVASVQGKTIGFCSRLCYNKFLANPSLYLPNVPGFEGKKTEEKKAVPPLEVPPVSNIVLMMPKPPVPHPPATPHWPAP